MKKMNKFDAFEMQIVTYCKKKPINKTYITPWWIDGNLPLTTNMIRFWNKRDGDHMLNEENEEVWCSWEENYN
jgi:hypothetical protein